MRFHLEKPVYGGSSLAHTIEGRAVFVPFTLAGETVEATLSGGEPLTADLVSVTEAAPDRVAPGCVHFGACGGCHYQHAGYAAQLRMKEAILLETLTRAGHSTLPAVTLHAGEPWRYRNRIRLRVEEVDGTLRLGYNRRASAELLPIRECPIAAPLLWRAAESLLMLAAAEAQAAQCLRAAAEVELACTNDQSRLQLTLLLRDARVPHFDRLCERLQQRVPELAGAGAVPLTPGRPQQSGEIARWGVAGLAMRADGRDYWVARGGFFQINRTLIDTLVQLVVRGRQGRLAWDLFAGVGLFTRALVPAFAEVVAVEASAAAVAGLAAVKLAGVRAIATPVLNFLRQAALERDRPELVVLDPPRAGLGLKGTRLLTRIAPSTIVYVSCDPTTLSRDLRAMVDSRYNLAELHLVDLFPQTFHLETVAVIERARG